jgi:hypothetical protein
MRIHRSAHRASVMIVTWRLPPSIRVASQPAIDFEQRGVHRVHQAALPPFQPDAFEFRRSVAPEARGSSSLLAASSFPLERQRLAA